MKRLIICCDGTWNSADQARHGEPCPTNVIKLAFRIAKRDGVIPQVVYYGQGVGTGNPVDRWTGGAFGHGVKDNIFEAYRFLLANYEPGDQLYFFGFSRGAYTARSLVGMVRKCGILKRRSVAQYAEALALYQDAQAPDDEGPAAFRREHSITGDKPIGVRMIGVWDTVGALGIPLRGLRALTHGKYAFHDVELSGIVDNAYQALAIDEHRAPFEAARWALTEPKPTLHDPGKLQRIEQVWFCGAHSDVGGGYPRKESGLSNIALRWMLEKAHECGLAIDTEVDQHYTASGDVSAEVHNSKTGMYRLTLGIDRVIGLAAERTRQPDRDSTQRDPTQSLHGSVLQRWDSDASYRPKNLRAYFRLAGDMRQND